MAKRTMKGAALAALLGVAFQWGCWGYDTWWGKAIWTAAYDQALEFVFDNDGVVDLFEDGAVAAQ